MRRRWGFSIAEVLVASTVFLVLAGCFIALYHFGLGSRRRHEAHQRSHRAALQCISYLRNELRVIQLLEPSAFDPPVAHVNWISYRRPAFDGPLEIDSSGNPMWKETVRLRFEGDHQLWRRPDNPDLKPRALAQLGPGGQVWFLRKNDQLLNVSIRADFGDPRSVVELSQNILLANQP